MPPIDVVPPLDTPPDLLWLPVDQVFENTNTNVTATISIEHQAPRLLAKERFQYFDLFAFSKTCESFFMNFAFALRTELMLNVRLFSADIDLEENLES